MQNSNNQGFMSYPYYMYQPGFGGYPQNPPQDPQQHDQNMQEELRHITQYIKNLRDPSKREEALNMLSRKRETFQDLPVLLWYSVGTITILLQ